MLRRVIYRLAILTVIVTSSVGAYAPCNAGPVLDTPAGLKPGDEFRFVFVTDGTIQATSSAISTYDSFVTAQAGGATYDGVAVSWQAIASTATVNAVDHVGSSTAGEFLASGTEVSTSTTTSSGGLWSGTLLNPIDQDLTGNTLLESVWTGTAKSDPFGHTSIFPLGDSSGKPGYSGATDVNWVASTIYGDPSTNSYAVYGISGVLIVPGMAVPEPSSLALLALGAISLAFGAYARRPATV